MLEDIKLERKIMAEPKKRISSTRSGNRRSHLALKKQSLSSCGYCHQPNKPHMVCYNCGTYKGEQILELDKKEKKGKKK